MRACVLREPKRFTSCLGPVEHSAHHSWCPRRHRASLIHQNRQTYLSTGRVFPMYIHTDCTVCRNVWCHHERTWEWTAPFERTGALHAFSENGIFVFLVCSKSFHSLHVWIELGLALTAASWRPPANLMTPTIHRCRDRVVERKAIFFPSLLSPPGPPSFTLPSREIVHSLVLFVRCESAFPPTLFGKVEPGRPRLFLTIALIHMLHIGRALTCLNDRHLV